MEEKNKIKLLNIACSITSAIFLLLSFPNFNQLYFAYFAFIPFIHLLYNCNLKWVFLYSIITSLIFYSGLVYWIKIFHILALPALLFALCLYFSVSFILIKLLVDKFPKFRILIIPTVFVSIEYIRSIGFLGFSWGVIGYSQHNFLAFIQIADIGGVWIVSFLVILINVILYELIVSKFAKKYIIILLIIFLGNISYGLIKLSGKVLNNTYKIALIQGNVDPNLDWDKIKYDVLARLVYLSARARLEDPELIVWSETAILEYIEYYIKNRERFLRDNYFNEYVKYSEAVLRTANDLEVYLLTGAPDLDRKIKQGKLEYKFYNSAFLISPEGKIINKYAKNHLVPFGEWFPYEKYFPFVKKILEKTTAGNWTPSSEKTVFTLPLSKPFTNKSGEIVNEVKFSCLICFEGIFGDLVRQFILLGAQFLINITNDMWSYSNTALFQHSTIGTFRAIENRVPFLRCGNSGVTVFIDPYGRVYKKAPTFKQSYLVDYVHLSNSKTIYTMFGDWFAYFLLIISILFFIYFF